METAVNETYGPGTLVHVDGRKFVGCHFDGATVHYDASAGVQMNGCAFSGDVQWTFGGAAADTINFLRGIQGTPGGQAVIDRIFANFAD